MNSNDKAFLLGVILGTVIGCAITHMGMIYLFKSYGF